MNASSRARQFPQDLDNASLRSVHLGSVYSESREHFTKFTVLEQKKKF